MRGVLPLTAALWLVPLSALAESEDIVTQDEEEQLTERAPPNISTDLFDPSGRSRFHLGGRVSFDDGTSAFSKSSVWALEAQGAVRIFKGLALTFNFPFGLTAPSPGFNNFFFGNFRLGVAGGHAIPVVPSTDTRAAGYLGFGGAFDVYAPTGPGVGDLDCPGLLFCAPVSQVRGLRSYEPFLYFENLMSFRTRGQASFSIKPIDVQLELGLTPAFTAKANSDFFMFLSWALRARAYPIYALEPFLEIGSSMQIAGPQIQILGGSIDASTPVLLTLGGRVHVAALDPALSVSFDLKNGIVIFGLDLAGAVRDVANANRGRDPLDFDLDDR